MLNKTGQNSEKFYKGVFMMASLLCGVLLSAGYSTGHSMIQRMDNRPG